MFDLIRKKMNHTDAYPHFMSILHHCLLMPCEHFFLAPSFLSSFSPFFLSSFILFFLFFPPSLSYIPFTSVHLFIWISCPHILFLPIPFSSLPFPFGFIPFVIKHIYQSFYVSIRVIIIIHCYR